MRTKTTSSSTHLCLSDFVRPLSSGKADTVGLFASTVNGLEALHAPDDPYRDLLIQTLGDRLAEAATEKMHQYVRQTAWGYAPDEDLPIPDLLAERFQGIRPAVGYPSLPDQSVNFILDNLLDMQRIGITLTENGAMHPHSSVSGLMLAHPAARYFAVPHRRRPTEGLRPPPGTSDRCDAEVPRSGAMNETTYLIIFHEHPRNSKGS